MWENLIIKISAIVAACSTLVVLGVKAIGAVKLKSENDLLRKHVQDLKDIIRKLTDKDL